MPIAQIGFLARQKPILKVMTINQFILDHPYETCHLWYYGNSTIVIIPADKSGGGVEELLGGSGGGWKCSDM